MKCDNNFLRFIQSGGASVSSSGGRGCGEKESWGGEKRVTRENRQHDRRARENQTKPCQQRS